MVPSKSSVKPRRSPASKPVKKESAPKPKTKAKSTPPKAVSAQRPSAKPAVAPKSPSKPTGKGSSQAAAVEALTLPPIPLSDEPSRILSLQFVRDGDEFLARMETATGHITELKNRSLDQLLTMVAGELEDLLG